MHVNGSRRTARLRRAICAFLGGAILAVTVVACGESSSFANLAPTPKPVPVVAQMLATVPLGRTVPALPPPPPSRTPETVTTMAAPTPIVVETAAPSVAETAAPTPTVETSGPLTDAEKGRELFTANGCFVCHGEDLSGGIGLRLEGRTPEDLTDERIYDQIRNGGNGMPEFPDLTDEQIDQLIALIRSVGSP